LSPATSGSRSTRSPPAPRSSSCAPRPNFAPDPEQELLLDAIFAEQPDGTPAIREIEVVAPRQNIKTGLQLQTAIGWMFLRDIEQALYTAHKWKTAEKTFVALQRIVNEAPFLRAAGSPVLRGQRRAEDGAHQRARCSSSRPAPRAAVAVPRRTRSSSTRTSRRKPLHLGALIPSMSTRPMAQLVRGSSGAHADSHSLRDVIKRGRRGGDPYLAFAEWCMPPPAEACDRGDNCDHGRETPGCGLDKPELLAASNSQYGRRITVEFVAWERSTMPPAEFARDRAGWHDAPRTAGLPEGIDLEQWALVEDSKSVATKVSAFGVATSPDQSVTAIGVAGPRPDGLTHLELVKRGRGSTWLIDRCVRMNRKHGPAQFVIAAGSPAATYVDDLREHGLTVVLANSRDVATACGQLVDGVDERTLRWRTHSALLAAVKVARRKYRADGAFVFTTDAGAGPIPELYAVALAKWLRDALNYDVLDSVF
jgi:hypothetical protein